MIQNCSKLVKKQHRRVPVVRLVSFLLYSSIFLFVQNSLFIWFFQVLIKISYFRNFLSILFSQFSPVSQSPIFPFSQCTLGQHVGVRLETWNLTKSAGVWLKVPGLGHILLVQWISGEILPHFDIKHIFVAQKMTELEYL